MNETTPETAGGLLSNRIALVTGGVGALGEAIVEMLALHGADVVIVDLDEAKAIAVAERIESDYPVRTLGAAADVSDPEGLEKLAVRIERELGVVDVVIPNAGILIAKPAVELTPTQWNAVMSVNLTGAFHTATVWSRRLLAARLPGSVIFTSSLFGVRGGSLNAAYSASKFGLIGLAQSMAAELSGSGIRVNSVCPGQVRTPMLEQLFVDRADADGTSPEIELASFVERIPVGRLGSPEEIAKTFVYLASDLSSYVTGESILVDGGWQIG